MKEYNIKDIREALAIMNPDADFNTEYTFFYDETNNIKKFYVKEEGYNNSYDSNFILGGVVFEGLPPNIKDLFVGLELQRTLKDVKFKHIAKGNFTNCLKSDKLFYFLDYLLKSPIYIHYSTINILYYSVVDIVDSAIVNSSIAMQLGPSFTFELKNVLYKLCKLEQEAVNEIFYKYQYPNIKSESIISFIEDLTSIFNPYIEELEYHVGLTSLKQILREVKSGGNLPFIMDNDNYVLMQDFYHFYLRPIYTFKSSNHIFDKEDDVEQILKQYQIKDGDEIIESYKFVDSESNRFIQCSDIVVGILGKLSKFLNTSTKKEIRKLVTILSQKQKNCLTKLIELIDKSDERNIAFLHNIASLDDLDKIKCLYEIRLKKKSKNNKSKKSTRKEKRKKPRIRTNKQIVERWNKRKRSKRTRIKRKRRR